MLKDVLLGGGFIAFVYVAYRLSKSLLGSTEAKVETAVVADVKTVETVVVKDVDGIVNGVKKDL
jgi:hypothetical protein